MQWREVGVGAERSKALPRMSRQIHSETEVTPALTLETVCQDADTYSYAMPIRSLTLSLAGVALSLAAMPVSAITCNPAGNRQEMNACAADEYKRADDRLNQTYRELRKGLPSAQRERLLTEQRVWLRKRDPLCKAQARPAEGGSIWALQYTACLTAATQRRTEELKHWKPR